MDVSTLHLSSPPSMRLAVAATALAFALLAGATPASAEAPATVSTVRVDFGDLNLATDAGTRALYMRLVRAARTACGDADPRDLAGLRAARNCESAALRDAVGRIGAPALTALHERRHSAAS